MDVPPLCLRFAAAGEAGLLDRRLGNTSGHKRVPVDWEPDVERLYRTRYMGVTARHFHEHLVRDHGFSWGYTWTKTFLRQRAKAAVFNCVEVFYSQQRLHCALG